jgi:hypothetical protein
MPHHFKLTIVLVCLIFSGCASHKDIELDGSASTYQCLKPKHKTVIAMHWDTCPLIGWSPQHAMLNQSWEVIPIISAENEKYYRGQKLLQSKLNKEKRDCSLPTKISELIELDLNTEINISEMSTYKNPSYQGVTFKGTTTTAAQTYIVSFRGNMKPSANIIGYNIADYFTVCVQNL